MTLITNWKIAPFDHASASDLASRLGISLVTAVLLYNRGYTTCEDAERFLAPDVSHLHDPFLMTGMDVAVRRIRRAIEGGERIVVYGDYDVDGVTSTALLLRALGALKANVGWHIPHRVNDGYGVKADAIRNAAAAGASVILTVDCGISAREQVALARELGMDVVITDHHHPPPELPDALAILNPKLPGSPYPFKDLAGVGVAFKLLTALVREVIPEHERNLQRAFLDLVAVGTIADVAPLINENRVFAKLGLEQLAKTRCPGLRALMDVAGIGKRPASTHDVGFGIGPRLNAGGRLDTARHALELLITRDCDEASRIAQKLDSINRDRQEEEARIVEQARGKISFDYDLNERAIVLASSEWHVGVVGIAASRIVDQYHRPVILLSTDGDTATGSGRSIEAFHLYEALEACSDLLNRFGGHRQAAGVSLPIENLDRFRQRFCEVARAKLSPDDLIPIVPVDAEITASELGERFLEEIERLAPFGAGNPRPQFAIRKAGIVNKTTISNGAHLKLRVKCADRYYDALWWRNGDGLERLQDIPQADLCVVPEVNEYNGYRSIQFIVRDVIW